MSDTSVSDTSSERVYRSGVGLWFATALVTLAIPANPPRVALVPNAVAFRDAKHGLLGTGWTACAANSGFGCRPQGTISATSDGGHTWRVLLATNQAVVSVSIAGHVEWARFADGVAVRSLDGGRTWRVHPPPTSSPTPCPKGANFYKANQVVSTPNGKKWALCVGVAGTGNQSKAVYKLVAGHWKRIASTAFPGSGPTYGGISSYGYPEGLAMADDGFGLIWESRGTLYVTRDGGYQWTGLPKIAVPERDFGHSGAVLPGGIGFVVLALGGREVRRLIETNDSGRTWHTVHRWR